MRLLVEENLPPWLAAWFRDTGEDALHVYDLGLDHVADTSIRDLAREALRIVVTKDDDFLRIQRSHDTAVLLLTCGNLRRAELIRRFAACWPELRARLEGGERVVVSELMDFS